jgi:hypothetical protein
MKRNTPTALNGLLQQVATGVVTGIVVAEFTTGLNPSWWPPLKAWVAATWAAPVTLRHPVLWEMCAFTLGCVAVALLRWYVSRPKRRMILLFRREVSQPGLVPVRSRRKA